MDYLRTLGSAAVSSLVQKSGLNLPFTLGQKVTSFETFWTLYDATKRDDGSLVSVFEYDFNHPLNKKLVPLAKNSLRKLRTVRHPDILKFMDVVETDSTIHIMTERVRPLSVALDAQKSKGAQEKEDWLLWGLHRISVALAFINDSCGSTHGNLRTNAIFISPSGEWKLGGLEALSNPTDEAAVIYTMGGLLPDSSACMSPEVRKGGWTVLKDNPPSAADAYSLGLLLHAVFNPSQAPPPTAYPPHPPPQASSRGAIPTAVFPHFKKLLNPNPKGRMSAKAFLEVGMVEESGFFANNRLVKICGSLDNFALGSEGEKAAMLRTLKESAGSFPPEFASYKVLPSLVSALEFGGASAAMILPIVLQLGKNTGPEEYPTVILGPLIKLFASPDRGTRMALLDHLPEYADKLDKKMVTDKIWPHLHTGFEDTVAVIREATVKSIILLSPKLSDRIMNNELLRHLAKMQTDPEASIRTNTCILIGRLAPALGYNTKRKVLVPAFSRALKDPFVHARVAGLMAFMAVIDVFDVDEIATKVIPNVSGSMIDKEKLVRDQAFKAIELFVKRLESHATTMPETAIREGDDQQTLAMPAGQATLVNSATGAAGALAGWAISSLGKQLKTADMQSTMNIAEISRPISAPPPPAGAPSRPSPLPFVPSASSVAKSTVSSPAVPRGGSSRAKGMQLGANKVPAATLAMELEEEATSAMGGDSNPWGTDDLIDINADEDDWSAFETALTSPRPAKQPLASNSRLSAASNGRQIPTISAPNDDDDAWGGMDPAAEEVAPIDNPWAPPPSLAPTRSLATQPKKPAPAPKARVASPSPVPTPISSPPPPDPDGWGDNSWVDAEREMKKPATPVTTTVNLASLSKEEKAAEIARRKEERKQRIAALKEQKKGKP
ncbi:hypothetical protein HWV62_28194 [Athelia sp. TMB]|nr:hypothetical protein HWV62_28194 [Athelia sp. TMB]